MSGEYEMRDRFFFSFIEPAFCYPTPHLLSDAPVSGGGEIAGGVTILSNFISKNVSKNS